MNVNDIENIVPPPSDKREIERIELNLPRWVVEEFAKDDVHRRTAPVNVVRTACRTARLPEAKVEPYGHVPSHHRVTIGGEWAGTFADKADAEAFVDMLRTEGRARPDHAVSFEPRITVDPPAWAVEALASKHAASLSAVLSVSYACRRALLPEVAVLPFGTSTWRVAVGGKVVATYHKNAHTDHPMRCAREFAESLKEKGQAR